MQGSARGRCSTDHATPSSTECAESFCHLPPSWARAKATAWRRIERVRASPGARSKACPARGCTTSRTSAPIAFRSSDVCVDGVVDERAVETSLRDEGGGRVGLEWLRVGSSIEGERAAHGAVAHGNRETGGHASREARHAEAPSVDAELGRAPPHGPESRPDVAGAPSMVEGDAGQPMRCQELSPADVDTPVLRAGVGRRAVDEQHAGEAGAPRASRWAVDVEPERASSAPCIDDVRTHDGLVHARDLKRDLGPWRRIAIGVRASRRHGRDKCERKRCCCDSRRAPDHSSSSRSGGTARMRKLSTSLTSVLAVGSVLMSMSVPCALPGRISTCFGSRAQPCHSRAAAAAP